MSDPLAGFKEIWDSRTLGSCKPAIYLYSCPICGATVARNDYKHDGRAQHLAFHDEQGKKEKS